MGLPDDSIGILEHSTPRRGEGRCGGYWAYFGPGMDGLAVMLLKIVQSGFEATADHVLPEPFGPAMRMIFFSVGMRLEMEGSLSLTY